MPELLQAGDTRYLVGHDTLGEQVGNDWRYYLPDALGSLRQSVDAAGDLLPGGEGRGCPSREVQLHLQLLHRAPPHSQTVTVAGSSAKSGATAALATPPRNRCRDS